MKANVLFIVFLFTLSSMLACKKDGLSTAEATEITTLETEYIAVSGITDVDYAFNLRFEKASGIKEYGIVFIPWINEKSETTPTVDSEHAILIPFEDTPATAGVVITKKMTFYFFDFNNANYRAYAILKNGTVVYGETLYFALGS